MINDKITEHDVWVSKGQKRSGDFLSFYCFYHAIESNEPMC